MKNLEIVVATGTTIEGLAWDEEAPGSQYLKKQVRSVKTPMDIKEFLSEAVAECLPRIGAIGRFCA